jgi:hypothetical protein
LIGLFSAATVLHHRHLGPRNLIWSLTIAFAIQVLIAAALWRARRPLIDFAKRLKIPPRLDEATNELKWLLLFNSIAISLVVVSVFWIAVVFVEWPLRTLAALAIIAQMLTFGLMAEGRRRRSLQQAAVAMFVAGLVFVGWAFLSPGPSGTWLNRAVILMIVTFAVVGLFGGGLSKFVEREPDWTSAFRNCIPAITISGIAALAFIVCTEVYFQIEFRAVRVSFWALATVGATLAIATAVCILFAVSSKHDPLALPDRWRGGYVYAAEVLLVLLFMHIG